MEKKMVESSINILTKSADTMTSDDKIPTQNGKAVEKVEDQEPNSTEKMVEKFIEVLNLSEDTTSDDNTPIQNGRADGKEEKQELASDAIKTCTPDRLKDPKAFRYPERYRSPTDSMMSPVSKGLLARSRKPAALIPPSRIYPKVGTLQEVGLFGKCCIR